MFSFYVSFVTLKTCSNILFSFLTVVYTQGWTVCQETPAHGTRESLILVSIQTMIRKIVDII